MNYDDNDIQVMSLCVWKEARGEGQLGMEAVANVINNRAKSWYKLSDNPIHTAVYAKNQFTSMSISSDPQYNLEPRPEDVEFILATQICKNILGGLSTDLTDGACYYYNPKTATSKWFVDNIVNNPEVHPKLVTIGRQEFFK